jgi:AraC-like DNA-binding protein
MFQLSGLTENQEAAKSFIRESGVDPDPDSFSPTAFKRILANAIITSKDEHFGHSKEGLRLGATALAFRIMYSGSNVLEAQKLLENTSKVFSPNHMASHIIDGDDVIMIATVSGFDAEHSAAVELNHIFLSYSAYSVFVGKMMSPKVLYSKSRLYTSLVKFNDELNCPVEYADFSGLRFNRSILDFPRRAVIDRDPLYDAVRWSLLTPAMRSVSENSRLPLLTAEKMSSDIESKIKSRNVDVRQKRRIVKADIEMNERDLHKGAKMAHAMVLLVTTNRPVEEIATDLGFSEERSFRRFFSGMTGKTPLQYRMTHQEPLDSILKDHFGKILESLKTLN